MSRFSPKTILASKEKAALVAEIRDARIDRTLEALLVAWRRSPDLRLGQLIVNVTDTSKPFYVTDEEILRALKEWMP